MGSIKTFSPCSPPSHFQNLKSSKNCNSSTSLKPLLCSMNPLNIHSRHKLHISSNICSKSPFPQIPTSSISKTNNNFTSFLSEKVLVSLVGAFIFIGSFGLNTRQSLALPAQTSGGSVNLEGKRDAQMVKSEDEEMYEKVLEKEPRNVEALKVVLHWKMRRGQTKEAVKYVERLIEIEPEEVEWRLLEALCYEMMGQLNKAKRLFNEILEERPLLLRALHGDFEEALKKFQGLVSDNPRDFRPYLCQGIIYSLLDRKEEAAEQFETYRSLVPEEFPQRIFLDDVVLEAKTKSRERFQKEFQAEFSYRK
ncbi:protein SLOW GREEN 1, chloroplastic-like isoform X3 [Populus nigra]|uniref:protein SLOW GREEN 1, chloroplastic-like isoform X3 n=1 Tax=Populus nigra TaxID=3691 RepID=UPI002B2672B3|nr:protein SLOW GREEN 1, chloroplastic-like isoform X3 [Populus nigra]